MTFSVFRFDPKRCLGKIVNRNTRGKRRGRSESTSKQSFRPKGVFHKPYGFEVAETVKRSLSFLLETWNGICKEGVFEGETIGSKFHGEWNFERELELLGRRFGPVK